MASEFLRRRRTKKIAEEYVNEIIDKLTHNPAVDKNVTIPFNAASLQKDFTEQLETLLERDAEEGERPIWRELFLRDEYKLFADNEIALLVKIFGDGVAIFGLGAADGNFKILSLCFTEPKRRREIRTLDFVFGAFTKMFLPKVAPDEVRDALKVNYFFTAGDLLFTLIQSGKLNMLNVVAERSS